MMVGMENKLRLSIGAAFGMALGSLLAVAEGRTSNTSDMLLFLILGAVLGSLCGVAFEAFERRKRR